MLSLPVFHLHAGARRAVRAALPLTLASGLVAGALVAVGGSAAEAAAVAGTYTIGGVPIPLNQPSDPGMGILTPTADAALNGMFGPQQNWPLLPLHAALDRQGDLVTFGTPLGSTDQGGLAFDRWTVSAGFGAPAHADTATMNGYNAFCNALAVLPDGRMLMVGGNSDMSSMIYDPVTGEEASSPDLAQQRWYATSIRLEDGRVLVLGGSDAYTRKDVYGSTPEVGDGVNPWQQLTGAASTDFFGVATGFNNWWYPRAFNAAGGTVVGSSGDEIWSLDPSGTGSVQRIGTLPFNPQTSGSQVMFAPGQVLVAGGGQLTNDQDVPATSAAAVYDTDSGAASSTSAMHFPRNWLNLTVLPTGLVWANGGTTVGMGLDDPSQSVKQSEMWNPATGVWTLAATAQRTRTYHSTSILMPSGAVFTGGSGSPGPENNLNAELYYPASLFTTAADGTVQWADRPSIETISGSATYGGTLDLAVGDGQQITSTSLITLPTETHSQDVDQRRIPLQTTQQGDQVSATLPAAAGTMPAGDYELTVVNSAGVPSAAQIITIRNGQPGTVTVASGDQVHDGVQAVASAPVTGGTASTTGAASGAAGGTPGGTTEGGTGTSASTPAATGRSVALTLDSSVGLEPVDRAGSRIGDDSGAGVGLEAASATSGPSRRAGTSWVVRTGLASSGGISFESVQRPGWWLSASSGGAGRLQVLKYSSSSAFAARATFIAGTGATGHDTTLHSWTNRSLAVSHLGDVLTLQRVGGSVASRRAATFAVRAGYAAAPGVWLTGGAAVGLESIGRLGSLVSVKSSAVAVRPTSASSSWSQKNAATWIVHASSRGVSFESRERPGWFLATSAYGTGTMVLARWSAGAAFTARTVFRVVGGAVGHDRSLVLAAHQDQYLTQSGGLLRVLPLRQSGTARSAASFVVHTGLVPKPTS